MSSTLRLTTMIVSLEAESGAVAEQQALSRLPSLFSQAQATFGQHIGSPLKALFEKRDFAWTVSKLQGKNYMELRNNEIFVPPGLRSDLLTYVIDLERCCALAANVKKDVLRPFNEWLGRNLGAPENLASVTSRINIDGYRGMKPDQQIQELGKHFAGDGRQDALLPYGIAIKRNADWNNIVNHVESINKFFDEDSHAELLSLMHQMQGRLDTLITRLHEQPEVYKMSPAALKSLATTTYDVARALELYALMRYKTQELNTAMRDNEPRLKSWI